jgi:hypothetical protein
MKKTILSLCQPLLFVIICVVARVLPHPANFTPIGAIALFGGTYLTKKQAFTIPIVAMLLSDLVIGFDNFPMRLTVYGSILIGVFFGLWIKKNKNVGSVIGASLFSSVIFFLLTNFTVWAFGTMYSKGFIGLLNSYYYAIPFFKNTLLGDLFYSGVFFGGYEFAKSNISRLVALRQKD